MTQTDLRCILWFLLGTQRSGTGVWIVVGTHICSPHLPPHCPIAQIYSCLLQRKTPRRHNFLHTRLFSEIYLENSYRHHLQDERKERKMLHILSAFLYPLVDYRKSFWTLPFWRWKKIEVTLGAQYCCSGGSSEITSLVQHSGMKLPFERSIEIKFYFHCRCFFRLIPTTQNQSSARFSPYFKVEPGISCRPNWDRWQDYHPLEMPLPPLPSVCAAIRSGGIWIRHKRGAWLDEQLPD